MQQVPLKKILILK